MVALWWWWWWCGGGGGDSLALPSGCVQGLLMIVVVFVVMVLSKLWMYAA